MTTEDMDLDGVVLEAAKAIKAEVLKRTAEVKIFPTTFYGRREQNQEIGQPELGYILYRVCGRFDDKERSGFVMLTPEGIQSFQSRLCLRPHAPGKSSMPVLGTGIEYHNNYLVYGNNALKVLDNLLREQDKKEVQTS